MNEAAAACPSFHVDCQCSEALVVATRVVSGLCGTRQVLRYCLHVFSAAAVFLSAVASSHSQQSADVGARERGSMVLSGS